MEKAGSFDAFQVEPTSLCNLHCKMCPRTRAESWQGGSMPLKLFKKISGSFYLTRHVHLQGWGEPLLHRDILEMIRLVRDSGPTAGITTNATLLDETLARGLCEAGLEVAGISVAGAEEGTHSEIRRGSSLKEVLRGAENLLSAREGGRPKVVMSFMMTTPSIDELPEAVKLAGDLGVDELVATNLDHPCDELGDTLKVFSCSRARQEHRQALEKAEKKARDLNLSFRAYPLEMEGDLLACELDPSKNLFISHDGYLGPCVYLNQTRGDKITRIFCGEPLELGRVCFGDVNEERVESILERGKEFIEYFNRRKEIYSRIFRTLPTDMTSSDLERAEEQWKKLLEENPLPRQCTTCYKAYGL